MHGLAQVGSFVEGAVEGEWQAAGGIEHLFQTQGVDAVFRGERAEHQPARASLRAIAMASNTAHMSASS
jgi:hypothetical protein